LAQSSSASAQPIIAKLESVFAISDDEREAVRNLPLQVTSIRADQDVVREGDRPSRCFAILEGFACTFKHTGDGKRQIMGFFIPGDMPDLQSLHLRTLDHSIGTITPCTVGFIPHEAVRELCRRHPRIGDAFWRETLVDGSIFREWVVNNGRRDARSRVAHVFCELLLRMKAIGLTQDHSCEFPITQVELADATGMSGVHVNRVLQELRSEGLIILKGSTLTVPDWEKLKAVGDFDPTYLHFEQERAAA
jgi:CRP-like cAMP-binding protein